MTGSDELIKYYEGDTYQTAPGSRVLADKLFLNTSLYFIKRYIGEVLDSRAIALKGEYDNKSWANASYSTLKSIEMCGGVVNLSGLNNIKKLTEPVVYISNHMSTLETFVFPHILLEAGDVSFVVKESLTTDHIFGPVMRATNPIVVKRKHPREDFQAVMDQGKELLQKGTSVVIFPQSTREVEFKVAEFNTMGIKLAKTAGVKVLPIAIKTDFWANGKLIKDLGTIKRDLPVYMKFGEPMEIEGNGKKEHQQIIEFITDNLLSWGGKVEK